ncbi:MAG: GTP-binding protein [Promethearchaeota archaeon]
MSTSTNIQTILDDFIQTIPDLLAVLVIDFDGFIIAKKSVKKFDDELIGGITSLLDQTLNRIKRLTQSEIGSGSFNMDNFRLFYIQLGENTAALLVLIMNNYSNLDLYVPYTHIIADKISLILSQHEVPCSFPKIDEEAKLILNSESKNVLIIGSEAVGKSAFVRKICSNDFIEYYYPTIGVSLIEKQVEIESGDKCIINFFDLSSLKSFGKVRKYFFNYASAILIMFDYSREETLDKIEDWIAEARQFIDNKDILYLIVGNKIDLGRSREHIKEKAEKLALEYECTFFETSILTGEGIEVVLRYLTDQLFRDYGKRITAVPITDNFLKDLTEDERIIFICNNDCKSIKDDDFPNVLEKSIINSIAKYKEISLAVLISKLTPLEKALNRTIDRNIILKIIEKYVHKGQVKQQYLKFDRDLESFKNLKIIQKKDNYSKY